MEEIWKDVVGYEGLYQVSNLGRVKSLYKKNGAILKAYPNGFGYLIVSLFVNGNSKKHKVHRLVANAFIPNIHNLPCVNHKDENKTNNFVFVNTDGSIDYEKSNLEWCTYKYNTNYGNAQDRRVVTMFEKYNKWPNSRAIIQFTKDNSFVKEYVSAAAAEEENGFNRKGIGMCASGKLKTYKGFVWRYK